MPSSMRRARYEMLEMAGINGPSKYRLTGTPSSSGSDLGPQCVEDCVFRFQVSRPIGRIEFMCMQLMRHIGVPGPNEAPRCDWYARAASSVTAIVEAR
jgi:hypothetical protein